VISGSELKAKMLELLEKDEEFRYAVAGKLGILEILKRLDRIEDGLKKLYEKSLEHDKRFNRIELELGALSESFYCKALWDELREEIKAKGEKILCRKRNMRINDVDIDLFIETDKTVYVVEVKVKPKHDDVGRLIAKADLVKKYYPHKRIISILAGALIGKEVEEYAKEKGIIVYMY